MSRWGLFGSRKDNVSDGSISPTPMSKRDKRKEKSSSSSHGMAHLRDYTSGEDPRMYHLRSGVDPRSNGRFIDMQAMYGSRGEPEFIRSRLMSQFQSSLDSAVTDSIRKACIHWDDEVLNLENNYHSILEERNGLKTENKNLANRVKTLEQEVNAKVALLREFQSGHLKTTGTRKLPPSSSAIGTDYENLERRIKDTVFARLARLGIHDPYIQVLLQHQPFLEAVKGIMVDEKEAQDVENMPLNLLDVVEESEKKGLLLWMIRGVIHDVLHRKIMKIKMPGLDGGELTVIDKIFDALALSEDGQGIKAAQEWRSDTYRRLAYWAENVEELAKYIGASPALSEMSQVFGDLIDGAEKEIIRILEPFCDQTPEGQNFSRHIVDIVDRAFQFSILIGSQTAKYELHRDIDHENDFEAVPNNLEDRQGADNTANAFLFYAVPALVKTSGEDGEAYDVSELLTHGKIYVLFDSGDPIGGEEKEEAPEVPEKIPIKMASPVNGGDADTGDIDAITNVETSPETETSNKTKTESGETAAEPSTKPSGADTLPNKSNPKMNESSDQTLMSESNGATATTTFRNSESDMAKESLDSTNQLNQEAEGPNQETSTRTSQLTADPENLEPQPPATQKTPAEPSEPSPSSEHLLSERNFQNLEAHLTEIPASPSLPKLPSIPEQVVPLPQEATVATPVLQCPAPALAGAETAPPVQTQDPKTQVSHTALPTTESAESHHPQPPVETQPETSLELSTPSISPKQEAPSQNEPEQQLMPQLLHSSSEISVAQSTPRTLPAGLTNLSESNKSPIVATIQEEKPSVEIAG